MPPRLGRRGFFITLEGGDGSGKSTHTVRLVAWLRAQGHAVQVTREPGGTRLGERVRRNLLEAPTLSPWAELLLFQALRAQHVAEVIKPALARGRVVVCDRYSDSTMAYQGYGLGLDRATITGLTRFVTREAVPDLTILLDTPPTAGLRRARVRRTMERRGLAFQRRVRAGFLAIAREDPRRCRIVTVQPTSMATQTLIRQVVSDALQRRRRP